ncbi:hypothetical protein C5U48_02565 [Mycolicibacter virginiensis]|uniref:Uncharacterized protein n=1 Tax=Mycolicibacter virginiensis TaxID=1795032 RepID=A0A9X7IQN6_9MYCO|nr:hypothetical protein [Mycolicibacter virginiensis]PQM53712.1 hypothetical protein C5U48_02565 [Mycolicibacter virginiensis]
METTADYAKIRDNIETVAVLAAAAHRGVEVLDLDDADSLSDDVKAAAADAIWNGLCAGIAGLDRLGR